ncbi:hypothetical protein KIN20_020308 [Parelaphostrongylus tenuis]|uniref:Uncharacterized protein n=1 Tax=Parelaphostrongylus tenuis TaxID=148309 RepID=A0AAD5N9N9_PARTN|nr:hypothetical protein KIN20_020308 [Parelaphostrongylus tenuis]
MKSTKLKGKTQKTNLLLDPGFNASQCRRSRPRREALFRTPNKVEQRRFVCCSGRKRPQVIGVRSRSRSEIDTLVAHVRFDGFAASAEPHAPHGGFPTDNRNEDLLM